MLSFREPFPAFKGTEEDDQTDTDDGDGCGDGVPWMQSRVGVFY